MSLSLLVYGFATAFVLKLLIFIVSSSIHGDGDEIQFSNKYEDALFERKMETSDDQAFLNLVSSATILTVHFAEICVNCTIKNFFFYKKKQKSKTFLGEREYYCFVLVKMLCRRK